jgi:hypothetical protein
MPEIPGTLKPPRLATAPAAPAEGQLYYDTVAHKLLWWDGSAWVQATGSGGGGGITLPPRTRTNWSNASNRVTSIDRNAWTNQQLFDFVMTLSYDLENG